MFLKIPIRKLGTFSKTSHVKFYPMFQHVIGTTVISRMVYNVLDTTTFKNVSMCFRCQKLLFKKGFKKFQNFPKFSRRL